MWEILDSEMWKFKDPDLQVITEIPQWPIIEELAEDPSLKEISTAINKLSNGKAPGQDRTAIEMKKPGGRQLAKINCSIREEFEEPNIW
ncbi:Hypothetical predicted protein [Octopus vulgaris]|uniref:Uncharacterized protein n=1 Tax=Octopus vulgaris TaxID=6645 RepID=A0AA36F296_OCTVU|nr:Hypothetical predicted protein [Octopus vulgaris]